jgi:serine/threonine protein kinase
MEYVTDGTLHDLLHTKRVNLSDFDKRRIAIQLITVISYLQRVGIVHGNLRSKNVLIDKGYTIKLSGFGRARHRVWIE